MGDSTSRTGPGDELAHAELVASLHCRGCGYDLRGLHVDKGCPECGLPAWDTLQSTIDPAASRLPRLLDPRGTGDALVWIMLCIVLSLTLQLARPIALRIDQLQAAQETRFADWTPPAATLLSGVISLAALWGVWRLKPRRGQESAWVPVWRDIVLLTVGLAAWGLMGISVALFTPGGCAHVPDSGLPGMHIAALTALHLVGLLIFIVILQSMRSLLRVIGERSREYRSARGGRQRMREMIYATIGIGVGQFLHMVAALADLGSLHTYASIVTWISALMLVIGLVYLLVNVWWIRRSLRRPPPELRDLIRVPVGLADAAYPRPSPDSEEFLLDTPPPDGGPAR